MSIVTNLGVPDGLAPATLALLEERLPAPWTLSTHPGGALMAELTFGGVDAALLGRPVSKDERVPFAKLLGAAPHAVPLASAPSPTVVVSSRSPLQSLEAAQLVAMVSAETPPISLTDLCQLLDGANGPLRPVLHTPLRGFWREDFWAGIHLPSVRLVREADRLRDIVAADPGAVGILAGPPRREDLRALPIIGSASPWTVCGISRPDEPERAEHLAAALRRCALDEVSGAEEWAA